MVDKLNRKLTLIVGGLAVAVIALLLLPFRLGLDLQGGTRLRYSVDLEKARAEGMIPADKAAYPDQFALQEIMAVWRKRVDPQGVRGVKLRSEGSNAVVVELPASANLVATKATSTITVPNIVPAAEGVPASIGASSCPATCRLTASLVSPTRKSSWLMYFSNPALKGTISTILPSKLSVS